MKFFQLAILLGLGPATGCARMDSQRRTEEARLENLRTHQPVLYELEQAERRRVAEQGDHERHPLSHR